MEGYGFSRHFIERIGKRKRKLTAPFSYRDTNGYYVEVPEGFETDYASIEPLKRFGLYILYALLAGYGDYASTIHDYLYRRGAKMYLRGIETIPADRKFADQLYYRALRAEGLAKWRALIFCYGVRLFGRKAWHVKDV